MSNLRLFLCTAAVLIAAVQNASAQSPSPTQAREYEVERTTYSFSDPSPIANPKIYPYFRFDTYAETPAQKKWKVIELENDFLKLTIYPEIGGKIWSAFSKALGEELLFDNPVIKFRDVAMRGPWTSGGMEFNFGVVGHSPHCSSPVDYLVKTNNHDDSASCYLSHLDLMTRTVWTVEVNLPADSAGFVTRVYWFNNTPFNQPYYSWSNLGVVVSEEWQAINPGTTALGHSGEVSPWHIDDKGRDLSWYKNNDFGSYKSYHVFGKLAEHYGYYDHGRQCGMAAYVPHEDRRGRKIWIWGLSREGMIWEQLLTDPPGKQYLEIQAGRLFIQNAAGSSATPFKHRDFAPFAVDHWEEHWLPVDSIGGFVAASPFGSMNVETTDKKKITIAISPAKSCKGTLEILDGEKILKTIPVSLKVPQPFLTTIELDAPAEKLSVRLGSAGLYYEHNANNTLTRPTASPESFDGKTAFGKYLSGCELMRQKQYAKAKQMFNESLAQDAHFIPALTRLAELANMVGDWKEASELCRRALAVDTYDADANYQFALASLALGQYADAKEAAALMSLSPNHRVTALTMQAKVELVQKRYDSAIRLAYKLVGISSQTSDMLRILSCAYRAAGSNVGAKNAIDGIKHYNPLDHFADAELFLLGEKMLNRLPNLQTELPQETYLELAAWYITAGRNEDAVAILELLPNKEHVETLFWLAWLKQDEQLLAKAKTLPAAFVFPFRLEALPVFEWAVSKNTPELSDNDWKSNYYLALLLHHLGKTERAEQLMKDCGDKPDFAAFYAVRAEWLPDNALADLLRAVALEPDAWRYGVRLARLYHTKGEHVKMLQTTQDYLLRFPTNDSLELLHAQALIENRQYETAVQQLQKAVILPNEGGLAGRNIYREATLLLAAKHLREKNHAEAKKYVKAAWDWLENLGSGKPYPDKVDERIEDWLESLCVPEAVLPTALDEVLKITGNSNTALVKKILSELNRHAAMKPVSAK